MDKHIFQQRFKTLAIVGWLGAESEKEILFFDEWKEIF